VCGFSWWAPPFDLLSASAIPFAWRRPLACGRNSILLLLLPFALPFLLLVLFRAELGPLVSLGGMTAWLGTRSLPVQNSAHFVPSVHRDSLGGAWSRSGWLTLAYSRLGWWRPLRGPRKHTYTLTRSHWTNSTLVSGAGGGRPRERTVVWASQRVSSLRVCATVRAGGSSWSSSDLSADSSGSASRRSELDGSARRNDGDGRRTHPAHGHLFGSAGEERMRFGLVWSEVAPSWGPARNRVCPRQAGQTANGVPARHLNSSKRNEPCGDLCACAASIA
jgi:hypothetical protein